MNEMNVAIVALTAWRENRGGGSTGMQSVINVIYNRARRRKVTPYTICTQPLQFSSITAKGDGQLNKWPAWGDQSMLDALALAGQAEAGELEDLTHGSTLYYAPAALVSKQNQRINLGGISYKFPDDWNMQAVKFVTKIADQLFFLEV